MIRIQTCGGHACKSRGMGSIFSKFSEKLGLDDGGVTEDGKFELIRGVACQGKCGVGPIVTAWKDGEKYVFTRVDEALVDKILAAWK